MTTTEAIKLLEKFRAGGVSRDEVLRKFQAAPVADLGFAQVDTHRALRKGFPEVIFGAGKTPDQVVKIAAKLFEREQRVLVTRVAPEHARALRRQFKHAVYHELARCVTIESKPLPKRPGTIAVVCAGTSDLAGGRGSGRHRRDHGQPRGAHHRRGRGGRAPAVWAAGNHPAGERDHRRGGHGRRAAECGGGLVSKPVIAVPTSVGYGASFGGLAPLLGMLNSCASGVTVVNIDNGFGAGYAASQINALAGGIA